MIYYQYIEKAKCNCGYIWTTNPSDSVICACDELELSGTIVVRGVSLVVDEDEFKTAVAQELNENEADITIIKL